MWRRRWLTVTGLSLCLCPPLAAEEPNEAYWEATMLPAGTLSVVDAITLNPFGLNDIDFFTFTGLTPGASFTAETLTAGDPDADSLLGWFAGGALLDSDDDDGVGLMSLLSGVVPAEGELTFAVTSYTDTSFIGEHNEQFPYELALSLTGESLPADFNRDDVVDGLDLATWKSAFGVTAAGDADADGDTDGSDLLAWQQQLGSAAAAQSVAAVPEPGTFVPLLSIGAGLLAIGRRQA
jgi:hypothetical protein